MDLHPAIVHFPIGLLSVYSLLELASLKWNTDRWQFTRGVILLLGFLGGIAGYVTGEMTGAEDEIAEMHELFATLSLVLYGVLAAGYGSLLLKRFSRVHDVLLRAYVRVPVAVLGFVALTITGALGGIMVYGPNADPVTRIVYALFF